MATWRRNYRKTNPVRKNRKVAKPWTREEIAFLRRFYRNHETTWCARQLGRTVYSVRYKASDLSIRKGNPSTWKNPGQKVVFKGTKQYTKKYTKKPTTRTNKARKNVRYARTRKNNRRTRW